MSDNVSKSDAAGMEEQRAWPIQVPVVSKTEAETRRERKDWGGPRNQPEQGEGEFGQDEGDRVYFWAFDLNDRHEAHRMKGVSHLLSGARAWLVIGHSGRHSGTPGGCQALERTCPSREKAVPGKAGPSHFLGRDPLPFSRKPGWDFSCLTPTAGPSPPSPLTLIFSPWRATDPGLGTFLFPSW